MRPVELPTRETVAFVTSHTPTNSVVLEVGCGSGDVALELTRQGYVVIAVDSSQKAIVRAHERGVPAICASWPEFECNTVDSIAFTRSLHHIVPLDRAIRRVEEVLSRDGVILIEDFSFDAADKPTIDWLLESARSPEAGGLIQPTPGELITALLAANHPQEVWRDNHDHDLHTIETMTRAVASEFTIREACAVPYLYRYLVSVLPESPAASAFLQATFDEEARLGVQGDIMLVGRRIVASR